MEKTQVQRLTSRLMVLLLYVLAVFFVIALMVPLLIANCYQVLTLIVYPFSRRLFYRLNAIVAGLWWGLCTWMMLFRGMQVVIEGDTLPRAENAIVISNHQGANDIPVLLELARLSKKLGNVKWFVKEELKYVPGVGWGMFFLGCLFVKRSWHKDKQMLKARLNYFSDQKIPLWLMIFPEGTRFRPEKLRISEKIAKRKKLPVLRHVLFPQARGFVESVQALQDHCQAVYDITILYDGPTPSFSDLLLGKVKKVTVHIRRFDLSILDMDPASLTDWLIQRFYVKDRMLADYRRAP